MDEREIVPGADGHVTPSDGHVTPRAPRAISPSERGVGEMAPTEMVQETALEMVQEIVMPLVGMEPGQHVLQVIYRCRVNWRFV